MLLLLACVEKSPSPSPTWQGPGVALTWEDDRIHLENDTLTGESTGEDVVLKMRWELDGAAPPRWWRQGWQSWSWSGVVEIEGGEPSVGGDGDTYSVIEETANSSWEAALLGRPGGPALHVGALAAKKGKVWLGITEEELWVVWEDPAPGPLEPVRLSAGEDPNALWEAWADRIDGRTPHPPPSGWSDWYTYYGDATEVDILRNLDEAAARGLELLQVDDGWERAWGDWEANADFPSGTAGLATVIRNRGLQAGLWMAPLLVNRNTRTYLDHPDWWVLDEAGEELQDGACDCATLDVTHPDAAAWMQSQIRNRVSEGWSYLKLDFLYAGAREGQRQQAINGTEAYALATELLRDAAGEDTWILACGAPMLPSVGFADSYRSGADIAFFVAPNADRAFLRWQARATAARAWSNGRWWWNDADNLMVGADPSAALAAQVASGGSFLYGEELSDVDVPDLTTLRGIRSRPEDPLNFVSGIDGSPILERGEPNDRVPHRWQLEDGTVVLLNLSEEPVELEGPGGTEWISGRTAAAGSRQLEPGTGEVWR